MDNFKDTVIFSQSFPDQTPEAMMMEAEELLQADIEPSGKTVEEAYQEFLERLTWYDYKRRPDASEKSEEFINFAKWVCQEFGIDTKIVQREHEVDVIMDIYFAYYEGEIKHALEKIIVLADNISFTSQKGKPDCFCMSAAYQTHDRYIRDEEGDED